jgi:hypothetical protein
MWMTRALIVAGLVMALAASGCAADESEGVAAPGMAPPMEEPQEDGAAPPEAVGPDAGGEAGGVLLEQRDIIYTGMIQLRVEDVDTAADRVNAVALRYEGFVGGDRRLFFDEHDAHATLTLRIPSEHFMDAVEELGRLGEEEGREVGTEDVTEVVVDVQTRLATAQASVDRTRELLDRAGSIADIVAIEAQLAEREARLASLQARQRALADATTLSTISVELLGPEATAAATGPRTGFLVGLSAGWRAFTASVMVLVTVFGALLPWLVAVGGPVAGAVWWSRRRRLARRGAAA